MLSVKRAATQAVSILGREVAPTEQLALVKGSGADRETKDLLRQCLITAMHFQSPSKENLEKSKTLVRKTSDESCEITSRSAAFTAASALKLKKWSDVDEMLQMTTCCPPAIPMSIRIRALAEQSKLDEALAELEKVLFFEEEVFKTENYSVSEEAVSPNYRFFHKKFDSPIFSWILSVKQSSPSRKLLIRYWSIENESIISYQMKRFRSLQRLITKYNRRTEKSIEDLLFSAIRVPGPITTSSESRDDDKFISSEKFSDFVKKIPYLKNEKRNL